MNSQLIDFKCRFEPNEKWDTRGDCKYDGGLLKPDIYFVPEGRHLLSTSCRQKMKRLSTVTHWFNYVSVCWGYWHERLFHLLVHFSADAESRSILQHRFHHLKYGIWIITTTFILIWRITCTWKCIWYS